jgi:hypothetical protein
LGGADFAIEDVNNRATYYQAEEELLWAQK